MTRMGRPKLPADEVRDCIVMIRLTRPEKRQLRGGQPRRTPLADIIRARLFPSASSGNPVP